MLAALALSPIAVILVTMVGLRWTAARAGLAGLCVAALVAHLGFGFAADTPGQAWLGIAAEVGFTALTILWIVLPALTLHELQEQTGGVAALRRALGGLTGDPRLVALLCAWFFALFLEGAAGFGAPVALAAPLLVGLGFPPARAVTLALIGHAVGVSFGAIGIPMLTLLQIAGARVDARAVCTLTAGAHALLCGLLVGLVVRLGGQREPAEGGVPSGEGDAPGRAVLPWAALAVLLFALPSVLAARFLGPELPTLLGGLGGGFVFALLLRARGGGAPGAAAPDRGASGVAPGLPLARAAAPYLALLLLVLTTRLVPPLQSALAAVRLAWRLPGGFTGAMAPLSHPGSLLLLALLLGARAQGAGAATLRTAFARALRRLPAVALALGAMLAVARVMVHAGLVTELAHAAARGIGPAWPAVAPWVGVLGTFVTGSATASNILFGEFQLATAASLALPATTLAVAQALGAAVGNIVCPHNIVGGCATVGLRGGEGPILRKTLPACAAYTLACGALVWLLC